ncbi:MAG: RNA polymerase sigma factor, partial [Bacteroidia bacterium]
MKEKSKFSIYSDEELMTFLCKGEVRAFDALYERYGKRLLVYFTRMLNFDSAAAEDALQDLFMKIAETPEKFDTSRSFKTWVFSVASNSCKNHYRHRKVVQQQREEEFYRNNNVDDKAFMIVAARLDNRLFRNVLREILDELPAEKKEVFIL